MEKTYLNCIRAFTVKCPHSSDHAMQDLKTKPKTQGTSTRNIPDRAFEEADALCQNCSKFTPSPK